ncbi:inorganic phosphate transporter, partial [Streptomyces sp. NPDC001795]
TLSRGKPFTVDTVYAVAAVPGGVAPGAIAGVTPPPAGPVVTADAATDAASGLKATIPAPDAGPSAEPTRPATV